MEEINIGINKEQFLSDLETIDLRRKQVEQAVEVSKLKTQQTWHMAVSVAKGIWQMTDNVLQAVGVEVSSTLRAVMMGAFTTADILTPLLIAVGETGLATVNPWLIAKSIAGLTAVGLSVAAAIAADKKQSDLQSQISNVRGAFGNINSMIGNLYWR